jgi:hypothetical protein
MLPGPATFLSFAALPHIFTFTHELETFFPFLFGTRISEAFPHCIIHAAHAAGWHETL